MRTKFDFLFAVLVVVGLLPPGAFASQDDSGTSPLSVIAQASNDAVSGCEARSTILLQFHYAGTQPLRGYLVALGSNEWVTGIRQKTVREIRRLSEPMIQPGAEWTRTICLTTNKLDGDPVSYTADALAQNPVTASVDVLKFADGSNWGPKALAQSSELLGAFDGMDFSVKATDVERYISPLPPDRVPAGVQDIQSQKIGPLTFKSGVWRDDKGLEMLAVEAMNDGDKAIRGYVFTETFFDPASRSKIRSVTTKQLATHEDPSTFLAPAATWVAGPRKFSHLPDGTLAVYKITLDFVVFADGSTFGLKKSRESDELLGMIDGIRMSAASSVQSVSNQLP